MIYKSYHSNAVFSSCVAGKTIGQRINLCCWYLDMAAECLELSSRDILIKSIFYLIKLKSDVDSVEENQLRILEKIEELLQDCYQEQLEN